MTRKFGKINCPRTAKQYKSAASKSSSKMPIVYPLRARYRAVASQKKIGRVP